MKIRLLFLSAFIFSCACNEIPKEQEPSSTSTFKTTVPSHLFFKNMRSIYYQSTQQANTRVDLYLLKKINIRADIPLIYPVIADNWMEDEAYLLIQKNDYTDGFKSPLTIYWSDGKEDGVIEMGSPPDFQHQYAFALELEKALRNNYSLVVVNEKNEEEPIFESFDQKSWFLTTLRDFEKLIEVE